MPYVLIYLLQKCLSLLMPFLLSTFHEIELSTFLVTSFQLRCHRFHLLNDGSKLIWGISSEYCTVVKHSSFPVLCISAIPTRGLHTNDLNLISPRSRRKYPVANQIASTNSAYLDQWVSMKSPTWISVNINLYVWLHHSTRSLFFI